jgi:Fic family protein
MALFDRNKPYNSLPDLPPKIDLESPELLKASIKAQRLLGELKGGCQRLPDPRLLINTIMLQESKDSSAIENIVTTQDELYRAVIQVDDHVSPATKEVLRYREALHHGVDRVAKKGLTTNTLVSIMQKIKNSTQNVRNNTGTRLANPITQEIIYTPPEGEELLRKKLFALETFIHEDKTGIDELIKMALVHYQFEAIHPFADGNGRTGRIMNVLYLVHQQLLSIPVLYLSSFIVKNKADYYRMLQNVTEKKEWKPWILFMQNAVAETAALTLQKIEDIMQLKEQLDKEVKAVLKNTFTGELVDLMIAYPYLKIKVLEKNDIAKRQTASLYLKKLADANLLEPVRFGKEIYYINRRLIKLFAVTL